MTVRVVSAAEAAARDAAAIAAGTPSRALMRRAGESAADIVARRYADDLDRGVAIYAGAGNNGGDAWVMAASLAARGVRVRVHEVGQSATADASAERQAALTVHGFEIPRGDETLVIDGVLGTGVRGEPRGEARDAVRAMNASRLRGATVVSLDVPSGLDASTGRGGESVTADCTLSFGTMKRGLLRARVRAGRILVLDIGLGIHAQLDDGAPELIDERWVARHVPPIEPGSHKGTRKRLAIVGGAFGMAGATILAARAALRSGIGMVRLFVAPESVGAVQGSVVEAMAQQWPEPDALMPSLVDWADAALIGPGLGAGSASRALVEKVLRDFRGPVVIDADALNVFAGDATSLASLLDGRPAILTPHAAEFARLQGGAVEEVLHESFDIGAELADSSGATVLLKGIPTVVSSSDGRRSVSASGTAALATAGSGDVLGGIAATLLAQTGKAHESAACAAWVHGRAAEIATTGRVTRGVTLADILDRLGDAWRLDGVGEAGTILAELPPPV